MSLSINNVLPNGSINKTNTATRAEKLEHVLSDVSKSTDEELMNVCKSFEAYFVEQVFKEMKKTVTTSEDNNKYMQYFGDMLLENYADESTKGEGLGIAQMLYESMKRN